MKYYWKHEPIADCVTCREYSQCLVFLTHLSRLKSLDLWLSGTIIASDLKLLSSLPLQSISFSRGTNFTGLEETKEVIEALKTYKSLSALRIQYKSGIGNVEESEAFRSLLKRSLLTPDESGV